VQFSPKLPVPVFPLPNLVLFPNRGGAAPHLRACATAPWCATPSRASASSRWGSSSRAGRGLRRQPRVLPARLPGALRRGRVAPQRLLQPGRQGPGARHAGRVVREYPYRAARVELLPQEPCSEDDSARPERENTRSSSSTAGSSPRPRGRAGGTGKPGADLSYEALVSALCMLVESEPLEKLQLLGLDSIIERGRRVREIAARRSPPKARPAPGRRREQLNSRNGADPTGRPRDLKRALLHDRACGVPRSHSRPTDPQRTSNATKHRGRP